MNLLKKTVLTVSVGAVMACTLAVGASATTDVLKGSVTWHYGWNKYTNTTYSEYYTDFSNHGSEAVSQGRVQTVDYIAPGQWSNARVTGDYGGDNGWSKWDN